VLYFVYLIVQATAMELLTAILGQFMGVGMIAVVILFQQEIKKFLLLISRTTDLNESLSNLFKFNKNKARITWEVSQIVEAMKVMAHSKTGALIVISAEDPLQSIVDTGDLIDAKLTKQVLLSIFFKNSPLHDGAVVLTNGRVTAARCRLPISENDKIPAKLGFRHRASIGMSEAADVMVLIVSEETGSTSVAYHGEVFYDLTPHQVEERLKKYLDDKKESEEKVSE
jgi:uncharacterized protein (TIGR00159 family)